MSVLDTVDNSVLAEVPVQTSPHSVAVHPTRPLVANVNYDAASVTMIDTDTDQVVATIPVGQEPAGHHLGAGRPVRLRRQRQRQHASR